MFEAVLETLVRYIGLVGPRKRLDELLAVCDDTVELTPADVDRIHTPIGIALSSETPYQIVHNIVAELLAVHNDQELSHLCDREGPIHEGISFATDESSDFDR